MPAGKNFSSHKVYDIDVGAKLNSAEQIKSLSVGSRSGRSVLVSDIADVFKGPEFRTHQSVLYDKAQNIDAQNAVTLSFSKRKGVNVVDLSNSLLGQVEELKKDLPSDIKMTVIRDNGKTAKEKSNELIEHLLIATISVSILIALAMGLRAALVVAIAIPVTLALTLATYYFLGYTLNRVTLFALIFSIGILVDDAIVVVENIERYLKTYKKLSLIQATLQAVREVGNPTVLATITVIASILPMAFVRGLMGPYMKPIPVGASVAMLLSLFVAFIITPWASVKLLKHEHHDDEKNDSSSSDKNVDNLDEKHTYSKLDKIYVWFTDHLLTQKKWAVGFSVLTLVLLLSSMFLVANKNVKVKMLPFDNKSEFQILLDYNPSTSLENSLKQSKILAKKLMAHSDVESVQIFAGASAPFSFSGMVKHTFMRKQEYMNDLHVLLKDKHDREKSGHDLINELRPLIAEFSKEHQVVSKVLEIPPGPPVMATMVAEIYGPSRQEQKKVAREIQEIFEQEKTFVDVDSSLRQSRPRVIIPYDYDSANYLGTSAYQFYKEAGLVFQETSIGTIEDTDTPEAIEILVSLDQETRSVENEALRGLNFPSQISGNVRAEQIHKEPYVRESRVLHRKNLHPVEYVMSELSGEEEAPVYGMLSIQDKIKYPTQTAQIPDDKYEVGIKWDGEWFITYEVFRDLGAAFAAVMILIYILIVGWFKSFTVPFIIMAPIPISLIGILPGHWAMGSYFTATSMIGLIAGAGVIVRNSIILVDFIENQIEKGLPLKEAVINAGVLRFRPMLLTASAVVVGSAVMLFDPIFQGLAISMIFGEVAATLLSRFMVPLLYFWFVGKSRVKVLTSSVQYDERTLWGEE